MRSGMKEERTVWEDAPDGKRATREDGRHDARMPVKGGRNISRSGAAGARRECTFEKYLSAADKCCHEPGRPVLITEGTCRIFLTVLLKARVDAMGYVLHVG